MRIRILPVILPIGVAAVIHRSVAGETESRVPQPELAQSVPARILDQYHTGVHELMAIVESATAEPANREEVCAAMDALGELRAVEAAKLLVEKRFIGRVFIDRDNLPDDFPFDFEWVNFPAIPALQKIGLPALEPVLETLGKHEGEGHPSLLYISIGDILGEEVAVNVAYVRALENRTRNESVKRGAERYVKFMSKLLE